MSKKQIVDLLINKINKLLNEGFELDIKCISSSGDLVDTYRAIIGKIIISYSITNRWLFSTIDNVEVKLEFKSYGIFLPTCLGRKLVKYMLKNSKEKEKELLINYLRS